MQTVTILGAGRAGGALAIAFSRAGLLLDRLIFRSEPLELGIAIAQLQFIDLEAITSDILIIATPDPDIRKVAEQIAGLEVLPKVALHLSGSLSSDELEPLRKLKVGVGSMHPLVSISDPDLGASRFAGAYFCIEGDVAAVSASTELVRAIGGNPFTIDTGAKPLYHASAVMASGNLTALFDAAIEMLSRCGLERARAHEVLMPLLQSTVANLMGQSTEAALTGPFVRGDLDALNRHLRSFEGVIDDRLKALYLLLAERSVEMVARSDQPGTRTLADAISMAKQKTGC